MLLSLIIRLCLDRAAHHRADALEALRMRDIAIADEWHWGEVHYGAECDAAEGRAREWESWGNWLAYEVFA